MTQANAEQEEQLVGFEPNVPQSEATKSGMLFLIGILPAACYLIGTIIFLRFSLNEVEHARVVAELQTRAASQL